MRRNKHTYPDMPRRERGDLILPFSCLAFALLWAPVTILPIFF